MKFDEVVMGRRSIRDYKPDPAPKAVITEVIMICVAMGYPDDSFPANAVVSRRKTVEEAGVFVGFED
jgi:hypothetical protein